MIKSAASLLTIQKFIYLLDDFHYNQFAESLGANNAQLPLKLAEAIRTKLPEFDSADEICLKVYGGTSKAQKQSFNQLSSYTFKLSSVLAINYPGYLMHNMDVVQKLLGEGATLEANIRAESLLDIATRVEDFQSQITVLKFLSQQAFLLKESIEGLKLDSQLSTAVDNEAILIKIQSQLRRTLHAADLVRHPNELEKLKEFCTPYYAHPCASIRILSMYVYIQACYALNPELLATTEIAAVIKTLDKQLETNDWLVLPFMSDIIGNFSFAKLNSTFIDFRSKEGQKQYEELSRYYANVKFWRNYLNFGQMYLFAIQTSRFMTVYHNQLHREDYRQKLPESDMKLLVNMIDKANEMLNGDIAEKYYEFELRSLRMLKAAMTLFLGGENIKKGIEEMERLLIIYQQVNMKAATDSIYLCLMMGYFAMKDYEKCVQTFKRYSKIIVDKPIFEGNDTKISSYYYLAQWLLTGSKQYVAKLQGLLNEKATHGNHSSIVELAKYFKIPLNNPTPAEVEV